jgi:hypothetical protein
MLSSNLAYTLSLLSAHAVFFGYDARAKVWRSDTRASMAPAQSIAMVCNRYMALAAKGNG